VCGKRKVYIRIRWRPRNFTVCVKIGYSFVRLCFNTYIFVGKFQYTGFHLEGSGAGGEGFYMYLSIFDIYMYLSIFDICMYLSIFVYVSFYFCVYIFLFLTSICILHLYGSFYFCVHIFLFLCIYLSTFDIYMYLFIFDISMYIRLF